MLTITIGGTKMKYLILTVAIILFGCSESKVTKGEVGAKRIDSRIADITCIVPGSTDVKYEVPMSKVHNEGSNFLYFEYIGKEYAYYASNCSVFVDGVNLLDLNR